MESVVWEDGCNYLGMPGRRGGHVPVNVGGLSGTALPLAPAPVNALSR